MSLGASSCGHERFPVGLAAERTDDLSLRLGAGARLSRFEPCRYCRDASQRPLQGIPADAPFHLPEPELPFI